jgi:ankyrin repeat protein
MTHAAWRAVTAHLSLCLAAMQVDRLRIYAFLNSAAAGNLEAIRGMVDKGLSVDCMDYDNRTALMLACHEGHAHVSPGCGCGLPAATFGRRQLLCKFASLPTGNSSCCI